MRPVLAVDLLCAGRAVLAADAQARRSVARRLVRNVETADQFLRCHGVRHPRFGDGTLAAAAARQSALGPEPGICDPAYARALILVLEALVARAARD